MTSDPFDPSKYNLQQFEPSGLPAFKSPANQQEWLLSLARKKLDEQLAADKAAAEKTAAEEAAKAAADKEEPKVSATAADLILEEILLTSRSRCLDTAPARISQLEEDIARLEAKFNGTPLDPLAETEFALKQKWAQESELRAKRLELDTQKYAHGLVEKLRDEAGEDLRKMEEKLRILGEQKEKEWIDYQIFLGLPVDPPPAPPAPKLKELPVYDSTKIYTRNPNRIYLDSRFWELDEVDRAKLEAMTMEEQAEEGFGPYEAFDDEALLMILEARANGGKLVPVEDKKPDREGRVLDAMADLPAGLRALLEANRPPPPPPPPEPPKGPYDDFPLPQEPKFTLEKLTGLTVTTSSSVEGYKTEEIYGPITGSLLVPIPAAGAADEATLGARADLERKHALSLALENLVRVGLNALVGLTYSIRAISADRAYIIASGTGQVISKIPPPPPEPKKEEPIPPKWWETDANLYNTLRDRYLGADFYEAPDIFAKNQLPYAGPSPYNAPAYNIPGFGRMPRHETSSPDLHVKQNSKQEFNPEVANYLALHPGLQDFHNANRDTFDPIWATINATSDNEQTKLLKYYKTINKEFNKRRDDDEKKKKKARIEMLVQETERINAELKKAEELRRMDERVRQDFLYETLKKEYGMNEEGEYELHQPPFARPPMGMSPVGMPPPIMTMPPMNMPPNMGMGPGMHPPGAPPRHPMGPDRVPRFEEWDEPDVPSFSPNLKGTPKRRPPRDAVSEFYEDLGKLSHANLEARSRVAQAAQAKEFGQESNDEGSEESTDESNDGSSEDAPEPKKKEEKKKPKNKKVKSPKKKPAKMRREKVRVNPEFFDPEPPRPSRKLTTATYMKFKQHLQVKIQNATDAEERERYEREEEELDRQFAKVVRDEKENNGQSDSDTRSNGEPGGREEEEEEGEEKEKASTVPPSRWAWL